LYKQNIGRNNHERVTLCRSDVSSFSRFPLWRHLSVVVTGIRSVLFPKQAAGSFFTDTNNREIGSSLIGQPFSEAKYFWPRPSATSGFSYNPLASGGSNSGATNPDFIKTVGDRVKILHIQCQRQHSGRSGAGVG